MSYTALIPITGHMIHQSWGDGEDASHGIHGWVFPHVTVFFYHLLGLGIKGATGLKHWMKCSDSCLMLDAWRNWVDTKCTWG